MDCGTQSSCRLYQQVTKVIKIMRLYIKLPKAIDDRVVQIITEINMVSINSEYLIIQDFILSTLPQHNIVVVFSYSQSY